MQSWEMSRRTLLGSAAALAVASELAGETASAAETGAAPDLKTDIVWLDRAAPKYMVGSTFGVPWPRGTVKPGQSFKLTSTAGETAVQSWPIAYWPDGSLKWSAHAVSGASALAGGYQLAPGQGAAPDAAVQVAKGAKEITVTSGARRWVVPVKGDTLIAAAYVGAVQVMGAVRLIAQTQSHADLEEGAIQQQRFTGVVETVTVEQSGPVRATLRLEGKHSTKGRNWLPFTIRLYFYAGSDAVRMVHSFIYDGNEQKDFINGLGVTADVPMRDALYDRHVRFTGQDNGVWGEAVRTVTGLRRDPGDAYRKAQVEGKPMPPLEGMSPRVRDGLHWVPAWGDFTLSQLNADGYTIRKRMEPGHAWIQAATDARASGIAYVGGISGGVAIGMGDFWQRAPTRLDIRNAASDKASVTAWLWSPDAPAMDLRAYRPVGGMDTHAKENEGLNITYEDYEAGWGKPYGIARTSELMLWALPATPSRDATAAMATALSHAPRLTIAPERLHAAHVFGAWSLPDRSTKSRVEIEDRLTYLVDYYLKQIDARHWYGFWDYGDVMHTYDADRHVWRYDVGGYAWDNSELSTDMLFWYSYLRTGRADLFRMAEAMTRHTGEVDVYHLGPYKGFGTRHGVQHFSDSSKQPRISNASYRRFYYFLTADERCGDLMHDLLHCDETLKVVDISRKLEAGREGKPNGSQDGIPDCGFGTSWGSFLGAWLAEWERTGDTKWRDRILNGMNSIGKMKRGWFAGGAPYDLKTGTFLGDGNYIGVSHLNCVFGIFEVQMELFDLVDAPEYKKAWIDYCHYYNASRTEQIKFLGEAPKGISLRVAHSRLTAYAGKQEGDKELVKRAWHEFFKPEGPEDEMTSRLKKVTGPDVLYTIEEDPTISTNGAAQWGLAAIANLALIGDAI